MVPGEDRIGPSPRTRDKTADIVIRAGVSVYESCAHFIHDCKRIPRTNGRHCVSSGDVVRSFDHKTLPKIPPDVENSGAMKSKIFDWNRGLWSVKPGANDTPMQ